VPAVPASARTRGDLCPGVFRPWPAPDGALVRLRLVGGQLSAPALAGLAVVARSFGDGTIHLTGRANLQLRGLPSHDGVLLPEVVEAIERTGLLPSRSHELVRNFMISPLSGRHGGWADLRPVAAELDDLVRADAELSELPGRFLFVLDDGRGDLVQRTTDLGLMALDDDTAQLRIGSTGWGSIVPLGQAPRAMAELAREFVRQRGTGADAPWHVDELTHPLRGAEPRDPRTLASSPALPYGVLDDFEHVAVPDGVLEADLIAALVERGGAGLVVTPWRGVLVEKKEQSR
jgi:precorrin-3B synthase